MVGIGVGSIGPDDSVEPFSEDQPAHCLAIVGDGQPEIHSEYANNQFLDTRGLPSPATGARAGYILQRLADLSKPFGTRIEITGDTAELKLKAGT